ncbi:MAG: hypothetical protein AABY83_13765 [Pseudomonadota bacterium]
MQRLGVVPSFSRLAVSDDNPYVEPSRGLAFGRVARAQIRSRRICQYLAKLRRFDGGFQLAVIEAFN